MKITSRSSDVVDIAPYAVPGDPVFVRLTVTQAGKDAVTYNAHAILAPAEARATAQQLLTVANEAEGRSS